MTVSQIADIHRRTPGSIGWKLKKKGIVSTLIEIRGYADYRKSDLYDEIAKICKASDAAKLEKKEIRLQKREDKATLFADQGCKIDKSITQVAPKAAYTTTIISLQKEVAELKKDVKEMLRLMNALYDFETS